MRVPLSWLRDFAPIEGTPSELAAVLNELGLIVDGIDKVGEGLDGVVVARVASIAAIEGADRIRAVKVDVGAGELIDVVCGAWNFVEGDTVALATVGTVLSGWDTPIVRRKMKGAVSNGMICSASELGLSEDHDGILVLPSDLSPGTPLADAMGIQSDVVFDLDITPNRPDAMSIAGVARDLAAALKIPFAIPAVEMLGSAEGHGSSEASVADRTDVTSATSLATLTSLRVEDPSLAPVFSVRVLTDVVVGESPAWVARRLALAGMRPINSVVDASNYVLLELGQPTHPYDLDRLPGRGLIVRPARPGEKLRTLDGLERALGEGPHPDCLICDGRDVPVGIAGVMGGESSEISDATTSVLLEVAYFTPMAVARTSKRLGLRTEASARYERGCDPEIIEMAAARVCFLASAGGRASVVPGTIVAGQAPERACLRLRTARVNQLLGTDLDDGSVRGYLEPIGFRTVEDQSSAGVTLVEVPSWRPDVSGEVDLIEEVGRHHGYSRVPRTVPTTTQVGGLTDYQRERRGLRDVFVGAGLTEVWTPSLLALGDHALVGLPGVDLELENPMSRDETVLRRTILAGMLRALRVNVGHRNQGLRFFEVGKVFGEPAAGARLPDEHELASALLAGEGDDAASAVRLWRTVSDALRLADPALVAAELPGLHPTRAAIASAGGVAVGVVGEVDPAVVGAFDLSGRIGWLSLDLGALVEAPRRSDLADPVSVFPSSDIDLAFVVDDQVPAAEVEAGMRKAAGELLVGMWLFDVYRDATLGSERRSLAWRLRFCALDHTLTDAEVAAVRAHVVFEVERLFGASLRG